MVRIFFASLVLSLFAGAMLLKYKLHHKKFTGDHLLGPQKHHKNDAIRIGGVVILAGFLLGLTLGYFNQNSVEIYYVFISSLPIFLAGLIEDITKKVRPRIRLFFALVSAMIGIYLLNSYIDKIGFNLIDSKILSISLISYITTVLAVAGTTHAFNIIDGHNGLSGMVSILILTGISYVSVKLNDFMIASICFALMGAIAGFLFWNFPKGHIFAGDGGAYLMGFTSCQLTLWMTERHPEISPWFAFLLLLYPVFETLFSMYRRKFIQSRSISKPDSLHLHSIIYKRMVRWIVGRTSEESKERANSMTSPYLWIISLTTIIPAILFWNKTNLLILFSALYVAIYLWLYKKIVRFRTPKFLGVYRYKTRSPNIKKHEYQLENK